MAQDAARVASGAPPAVRRVARPTLVRSRGERLAALPIREGLRAATLGGVLRAMAGYAAVTALAVLLGGTPATTADPGAPDVPLRVVDLGDRPRLLPPATWP